LGTKPVNSAAQASTQASVRSRVEGMLLLLLLLVVVLIQLLEALIIARRRVA
jgi:flagellar biogenesis protein FliO